MPDTPDDFLNNENVIPLPKLLAFVKVAIDEGVRKIRITGGEPMLRKDLDWLIAQIYAYKSDIDIALTTNGFYLKKYALALKNAGLKRINVSLDSLNPTTVKLISKRDVLPQILEGIDEAIAVGLIVKINMVPLKGVNDNEIPDLIAFAEQKGVTVRFIEFMENEHAKQESIGLRLVEILERVSIRYTYEKLERDIFGPATLYKTGTGKTFGIIAPHSDDFCESCNRVRLSSEGMIIPCLYFEDAINAREAIESGDIDLIRETLRKAVANKPEKNEWRSNSGDTSSRAFYKTGG